MMKSSKHIIDCIYGSVGESLLKQCENFFFFFYMHLCPTTVSLWGKHTDQSVFPFKMKTFEGLSWFGRKRNDEI